MDRDQMLIFDSGQASVQMISSLLRSIIHATSELELMIL